MYWSTMMIRVMLSNSTVQMSRPIPSRATTMVQYTFMSGREEHTGVLKSSHRNS